MAGPECQSQVCHWLPSCLSPKMAKPRGEQGEWMAPADRPSQGPWVGEKSRYALLGASSVCIWTLTVPSLVELPYFSQKPKWQKGCWSVGGQVESPEGWRSWFRQVLMKNPYAAQSRTKWSQWWLASCWWSVDFL